MKTMFKKKKLILLLKILINKLTFITTQIGKVRNSFKKLRLHDLRACTRIGWQLSMYGWQLS